MKVATDSVITDITSSNLWRLSENLEGKKSMVHRLWRTF